MFLFVNLLNMLCKNCLLNLKCVFVFGIIIVARSYRAFVSFFVFAFGFFCVVSFLNIIVGVMCVFFLIFMYVIVDMCGVMYMFVIFRARSFLF